MSHIAHRIRIGHENALHRRGTVTRGTFLPDRRLPVSDRLRVAAGIKATAIGSYDFGAILSTYDLVPNLRGSGGSFGAVRAHYAVQVRS